jgi:hypothetical protein
MIKLYDKNTGQYLGRIEKETFQFLIDNLEEENLTDTDYYVDRLTLDFLKDKGMSEALVKLLEGAMGEGEEIEVRYERE